MKSQLNRKLQKRVVSEIHTPVEEDESSEEEDVLQNAKKKYMEDANVEMVDAPSSKKAVTSNSASPQTSFTGNLTFTIKESDVINFFKDAVEVVEVRFAIRDDRFACYVHVEFVTREAAQEDVVTNVIDRVNNLPSNPR
ncbi:putative nucleotide-binding alpha-beta plait domain superfamily, RNA-binding domain superfamily [Helianthus anomalus]